MLKLFLLGLVSATGFQFASAQKKEIIWPANGSYRVDTVYNKKNPYPLFIGFGVLAEVDLFASSPAGFGVYVHGRYTLLKLIQVSGSIITGAPLANMIGGNVAANYDYHIYQARVTIPFKKSLEPVNVSKKLYSYTFTENGRSYNRTYSANFPVMASSYQGLTGSISQIHRYYGQQKDSGSNSFTVNNISTNDRAFVPALVGYSTVMFSAGFHYSQGLKFKGKVFATIEGRHKKKTVRSKSVIDMAFEVLMGATVVDDKISAVKVGNKWSYENVDVSKYTRNSDAKTKKFGFRFEINMKRGLMGMRFEMGVKPGIRHDYKNNDGKVDNEWLVKPLSNAYVAWGIGFGIGAL